MTLATNADVAGVMSTPHSQTAAPDKTAAHYLENNPSYELDAGRNIKADLDMPAVLRDLTPEALTQMEKRLVRKIDLRLLPMLVLMYIMNVRNTRSKVLPSPSSGECCIICVIPDRIAEVNVQAC